MISLLSVCLSLQTGLMFWPFMQVNIIVCSAEMLILHLWGTTCNEEDLDLKVQLLMLLDFHLTLSFHYLRHHIMHVGVLRYRCFVRHACVHAQGPLSWTAPRPWQREFLPLAESTVLEVSEMPHQELSFYICDFVTSLCHTVQNAKCAAQLWLCAPLTVKKIWHSGQTMEWLTDLFP